MTGMQAAHRPLEIEIDSLLGLPLFQGVHRWLVDGVRQESTVCILEDGQVLIERGAPNQFLYVIVEGCLRIHLDPAESPIASLGPGDTVGEISVFDKLPASATVLAAGDCTLLRLDETMVWHLAEASHAFAHNLLVVMTGRIRGANGVVDRSLQLQKAHHRDATIDALTGLYNRRWLDETLPFELARTRRRHLCLGLLMVDVDHFKHYNDQSGHPAGDAALCALAATMRSVLRNLDMAVRYGGEEFVVLLPGAEPEQVSDIAERLRQAVGATEICDRHGQALLGLTVSIGTAVAREGESPEQLIARADKALYTAKRQGRDRVAAG